MMCASPSPIARAPRHWICPEALLSLDEERRIGAAAARGDSPARDRLVRANLRLVIVIARGFRDRGLDLDDLVGEGNLGLIRAAERFDPRFGVRFSTHARHWIREAICSALTNRSRAIRLPSHMVNLLRKWRRAEHGLILESGEAPRFDQVADRLGLTAAQRDMVRKALESRVAEEGHEGVTGGGLEEVCGPDEAPHGDLERDEMATGLRSRMAERLDERERELLSLRFGLEGGGPMSLQEAGGRLGVTREWARKLERRAVAKLR
ncbi:sigma-70 family RNA polymerase sigma factor (plasmid) [Tundrisphaera lichenicola]|uniref:sigma-70 family RNA polymerase sigma factor n=1 Tax=Tundrisphaera lichenicola TaxID=2029860 RepID=UPI003EBF9BD2